MVGNLHAGCTLLKLSFLKWKFLQSQVVSTWAAIDLSLGAQSVDLSKVVAIPDIVFKEMINWTNLSKSEITPLPISCHFFLLLFKSKNKSHQLPMNEVGPFLKQQTLAHLEAQQQTVPGKFAGITRELRSSCWRGLVRWGGGASWGSWMYRYNEILKDCL